MNKLKVYTLTVLFSTLAFAPESRAATIAPSTQVKQAGQWFTGLFDNAQQVASKPSVPLITTSNCKVELANANPVDETENIYLEQTSSAFNRIRFYSFSEADSAVKLSIRSFISRRAKFDIAVGDGVRTATDEKSLAKFLSLSVSEFQFSRMK